MAKKISIKINYDAIDTARLFNGKKGRYLDITAIERDDEYGNNFLVVQDVTKEERKNKVRGPIVGNAKWLVFKGDEAPAPAAADNTDQDPPF